MDAHIVYEEDKGKTRREEVSRRERYMELDEPFQEPDAGPDSYLLEAMLRLGFQRGSEGGLEPPSWQELLAFQNATLRVSTPGDLETLRAMSFAYLEGVKIGELPLGKPPIPTVDGSLEVE